MMMNKCRFNGVSYQPYASYPTCRDTRTLQQKLDAFVQSPHVVPTIKAVWAFAQALRNAQRVSCFQISGLCQNLMRMSPSDFHNTYLKKVDFTFSGTRDGMRNLDGHRISFDSNGDPMSTTFAVWNYNSGRFQLVSSYNSTRLVVDVSKIKMYDQTRQNVLNALPTSPCPLLGCRNCLFPIRKIGYTYYPGDVLFGATASVRLSGGEPMTCGDTYELGSELFMAIKYALNNYKSVMPGILKGVDLGGVVADVCSDTIMAQNFITNALSRKDMFKDSLGRYIDVNNIKMFLGSGKSSQVKETSKILGYYKIPNLDSATDSKLGDRSMFPYFSRAVPSDDVQISVLINLLRRMGWTYFQVVVRSDSYGQNALKSIQHQAKAAQLCIAGSYNFEDGYIATLQKLKEKPEAKAVILYGYSANIRGIFQAVKDTGSHGQFVFIGTESWSNLKSIVEGYGPEASGSLTIGFQPDYSQGFNNYLNTFNSPDKVRADPVFAKWYEKNFNCYLDAGSKRAYINQCVQGRLISSSSSRYQQSPWAPYLIKTVYAAAQAIHKTLLTYCGNTYDGICIEYRSKPGVQETLLGFIRNVSFTYTDPVNNQKSFSVIDGEGTSNFVIYNYLNSGGYIKVGDFQTSTRSLINFNEGLVRLPGGTSMSSTCNGRCMQCDQYRKPPLLYIPGDIVIGGMFSISNPGGQGPFVCGDVKTTNGFQYTGAMQYAINMVNSDSSLLPGIKLGGIAMDHCNNPERASGLLSLVYSGVARQSVKMADITITSPNGIAAWMTDNTASTKEASEFLQPLNVPIVSPSATSASLKSIPTFYRTIQGDDTVAMAMMKLSKSLGFLFVQVVYANNGYGKGGYTALQAAAQQEGICITNVNMMSSATDATKIITSLAASSTKVVAVYLGTSDVEALLSAKAAKPNAANLVFILPEPFDRLVNSVTRNSAINLLSIKIRSPVLTGYIGYLDNLSLTSTSTNPFFAKYYQAVLRCDLPGYNLYKNPCTSSPPISQSPNFVQSNFALSTINAVYSIAHALDGALKQSCGNYNGICSEFWNATSMFYNLQQQLNRVSFTDLSQTDFRFRDREANTAYDILRYTGTAYEKIGGYAGASLDMTTDVTKHYKNVASQCNPPCLECIQKGLNFSYVPGDILLGGVFDVHQKSLNPFTCSEINTLHGFQLLEAFHFALGQVNSKEGMFANILRGTRLGGIGLDSCESSIRTGYLVSNIHNGLTSLARNGDAVDPKNIDVYIGSYASSRSIYLARILKDLKIPQISYGATSTELLDQLRYPYFYRTVPADDNQARAMISFLDKHDIRYVQVLYTQTNYGERGSQDFKRLAAGSKICVGQMVIFPDNGTVSRESSNDAVTALLQKPVANTVVLFAGTSYINALLKAVTRNPRATGKFKFIGSETWANNDDAIRGVQSVASGSVTLNLETANLKVFDDYLGQKTPANSQENPWFDEYYQQIQDCYLTVPDAKYSRKCPTMPLNVITSQRYKQDPGVLHVINAVYAAAFAIDTTLTEVCGSGYQTVCEAFKNRPDKRDLILKNMQTVSFDDPSNEKFRFTARREGNKGYVLYSIDFVPVQGYVYQKIGSFSSAGKIDIPNYKPSWDGTCNRDDSCTECPTIRNRGLRYAVQGPKNPTLPALTVVGVFDIHEQGTDAYRCGKLRLHEGFSQFLSFFYVMDLVETQFGLNIQAIALDTCSNSLRVDNDLWYLLAGKGLCNAVFNPPVMPRLGNVGGILTTHDDNTMAASRVLNPLKVTFVSPSAQSNLFNSTDIFPYLARTISPRGQYFRILADILKKRGWEYVSAVTSDWKFDTNGYNDFLAVSGGKTCVRFTSQLPADASADDVKTAITGLQAATGSNVVLLFTNKKDTILLLRTAQELGVLDKFLWVFTDISGYEISTWDLPDGLYFKALALSIRTGVIDRFKDYVASMDYSSLDSFKKFRNKKNVPLEWFEEFYQRVHKCMLSDAYVPMTIYKDKQCNYGENLLPSAVVQNRFIMTTIAAGYAISKGLNDFKSSYCSLGESMESCIGRIVNSRDLILNKTLGVVWNNMANDIKISTDKNFVLNFNSERFWDPGFIVWLMTVDRRKPKPKAVSPKMIGEWSDNKLMIRDDPDLKIFTSVCPADANCGCAEPQQTTNLPLTGDPYKDTAPRNYYRYSDEGEKMYDWPVWAIAVAVITCFGLLVAIIAFIFLLVSYPVRGGTTVLGFMIILGIVGIYAINFAFFLPASFETCAVRRFLMGIVYMIVFACLLVKAVDNWRYSDVDWTENKQYKGLTSSCALFCIAVGIVLIQAIIPIEWLILVEPTASNLSPKNVYIHDYMWCDPSNFYDIGLVLSFIFVMFIILLTAIFAALAWDSDNNYYESRWILVSAICTAGCFLVWMIVSTNAGPHYRDPAVAIANFINATALLICIPLRKMALLISIRQEEKKAAEEPNTFNNLYSEAFSNDAYNPNDYSYQRQDSKQESDVGF